MSKTLKVYKKETGEVVGQKEVTTSTTKITITGLEKGTTYNTGTFQVSYTNESGESQKVDVPEFTTINSDIV
ncbi:tail morphogenetic protein I [Staphylococcus phage Twort]|uniref:Tail morphogenetic protein I n=2 Tax=Staphylococcus phage Twort (strain DSM 17442 / HER 48) TaxID=2908167 RepID=A0A6H0X5G3_BPTWO|nr:major tail protein [Staphylococcus phage Twort]AAX92448.1 ORF178 [Staphylococcus phage Twort]QIW89156.1 tail morphogenetic protein I [Staphylococcus phage Twort]